MKLGAVLDAAVELQRFLEGAGARFCFIGGVAVQRWGEPRLEDLVVHKAFASRDMDWLDIDRILMRQGSKLNVPQILEELEPLVELKEDAEILPRLKVLMRKRDVLA